MKEHFRLCEKLVNRPFKPFCGKQWSWSNGALRNALLVRLLNEFLVVPSRNISIERIRSTGSWLLPLFQFSCRTWELNVCHSISLTGIKISLSRYDQIIQFYLLQVIRLCKSLGIESHTRRLWPKLQLVSFSSLFITAALNWWNVLTGPITLLSECIGHAELVGGDDD